MRCGHRGAIEEHRTFGTIDSVHAGKGCPIMKHVPEILIVDDDEEFVAELLKYWRAPLAVRIARSGKEAINYLRARVPRLVLLDLKLPRFLGMADELEGQALLANLKSRPGYECPVVIVTEETSPEVRSCMLAFGADAYLTKPVDVSELEGIVAHALR